LLPAAVPTGPPTVVGRLDGWHVDASSPSATTFVFVVRTAGLADAYYADVQPPFIIDPWRYGGRSVAVSARASGPESNRWAEEIHISVPPPSPVLTANQGRVDASLPGSSSFDFVVKATGLADTIYANVAPPFVVDPWLYAGRSVSVSARAVGRSPNPWSSVVGVDVADLKLFGIVDAHGPQRKAGADAKGLGVTLNRIEFGYGESIASMDAKVALDTSHGLTPLPLLSQYGAIAEFDLPAWQSWTKTVVVRYGPGGTFWQGRSDDQYAPRFFELLNEPYGYWYYPRPDPAAYARFFAGVVSAAQAANPRTRFLLAAHPQTFRDAAGVFSRQTWNRAVKAAPDGPQALALAGGVTSHSYGSQRKVGLTAVAIHNDFPDRPVWITEIGYRVGEILSDGTAPVTVTDDVQAARMQRSLVDYTNWPWAVAYVWFKWADYGPGNMWGVVRADGSRRPAYETYRSFIAANAHPMKASSS
jgi:hypothetical protein